MTPEELVQAYLEQRQHPKSTLVAWMPHIRACLERGMSYRDIADFLRTQSVTTTHSSVYRFIHAKKRAHIFKEYHSNQPSERPSIKKPPDIQNSSSDQSPSESPKTSDSASASSPASIPTFEWNPSRDKGKTPW